jgi:hypothetical protein
MTQEQKDLIKDIYNYYQYSCGVDDVNNFQCKIKETFPELFKPEKYEPKVGEWVLIRYPYDNPNYVDALVKFNGYDIDTYTYGFGFLGHWTYGFRCSLINNYIPATPEEVETRLRKYALEVLDIGDDTKIECHAHLDDNPLLNYGGFNVTYTVNYDRLWNKNGCIYSNGVWAKKKDPMPDDLKQLISKYGKETILKLIEK